MDLQLEIVLNGVPTRTISTFVQLPDGGLEAKLSDLTALGLNLEGGGPSTSLVRLSDIPTLTYKYDERTQQISISIDSAYQRPLVLDVRARELARRQAPRADWGAVVNYDLFAAASTLIRDKSLTFSGASLSLDGRVFSPFGVIEQTGLASVDPQGRARTVRFNTTFTYSDPARMTKWVMGDTINGGTIWSRPIRIGGFQVQSNFALRPDLVTTPMASLGGTAQVPSTVDLFVNNVRTYSQEVGSGPFNLVNVPLVNGAGNVRAVIRGASGQTLTASLPFFSSASLLAPGLNSWSFEAGLPRTFFAGSNDAYASRPAVSATWMHGASDRLTVGGHTEAGGGLVNGAVNVAFKTGAVGVASSAFVLSKYRGKAGSQASFNYETAFRGISVTAGIQRTLGDYEDLASVTARLRSENAAQSPLVYLSGDTGTVSDQASLRLYDSARAPKQLDHLTASGPLGFDRSSSWSVSYLPTTLASGAKSRPLTISYSRSLAHNVSVFATGFRDLADRRSAGVFLGFSMTLGGRSISTDLSTGSSGAIATVQASSPLGVEPGDVGWGIRDSEGAVHFREAYAALRTAHADLRASLQQSPVGASGTFEVIGAVANMGGQVFLSDRIDDAFAVVDAGAPGVLITSENRPIGRTGSHGMLLVPNLRSYQNNNIDMDLSKLPVDVEIQSTRQVVTPFEHAGLMVSFAIKRNRASALVSFVDEQGRAILAGSDGRINGAGDFVLGYDGQAFIDNLRGANSVTIDSGAGACLARFDFQPAEGKQVRIGPVVCRRTTFADVSPQEAQRDPDLSSPEIARPGALLTLPRSLALSCIARCHGSEGHPVGVWRRLKAGAEFTRRWVDALARPRIVGFPTDSLLALKGG